MKLRVTPLGVLIACSSFFLVCLTAIAGPEQIRYQGRITDGGELINGSRTFVFELFTEEEEGTAIFSETQTVQVVDGLYAVSLGASNGVPGVLADALTNVTVYLGVTVDGFVLLPRERIVSVAYALRASYADNIADLNNIPANGFAVGEDQLVAANGRVGIGTDDPQAALHVAGTPGTDGIMFPDGTVQTTAADPIPVGTVLPFAGGFVGSFAPQGYLLCDGSAVSRTTYAYLFSVIGTSFGGGDGSTTFNLPDLRGRAVVGVDNMGGNDADVIVDDAAEFIGGTLGAETHTLTESEMPAHNHGVNDPGHAHSLPVSDNPAGGQPYAARGGVPTDTAYPDAAATGITIANAGGGEPHNNVQPSLAMGWIIKATAGSPLNTPPIVNAGADQSLAIHWQPADLFGTVTDDGLPNPPGATTTLWAKISGPGSVTFGELDSVFSSAEFSTNGTYIIGLFAYDGYHVVLDTLRVDINQAPAVDPGTYPGSFALSEDLNGTVIDDGLPNPPGVATTLWEKVDGPGSVTFADASAVDTLATFSTSGVYELSLSAYDGMLFTVETTTVAITFTTPPTVDAGPDQYSGFLAATMAGMATDDGLPNPVTSIWAKVSGPGTANFANAAQTNTAVTFSDPGFYTLSLTAYDGLLSSTDEVQVVVYTGAAPSLVSIDFRLLGSFTNEVVMDSGVTITASQSPGVTGELSIVSLQGLGVVGGHDSWDVDTTEGVLFEFDGTNNIDVSYTVNSAGNLDADGFMGEAFVEAFDPGAASLGVQSVFDVGTFDVSALFSNAPISKFEVRADADRLRIRDVNYRPGP